MRSKVLLVVGLGCVLVAAAATAAFAASRSALATPAAVTGRMPVGFYDDPSFRWSPQAAANLLAASSAHASIVHTLVDWASVAPTRPANPLNGNDPAYRLSDLDALVQSAEKHDLQVLVTITGTPSWANGGQTPNHPPSNLNDLTEFAQMLASRYDGKHAGLGVVTRFSIWNEPNLGLFLTPQYEGSTIVSPSIYAKLFMAGYKGIKAGDPNAVVAAGETSNRGRSTPTGDPGTDSVAPGLFAEDVAKVAPTLPFVAWATHPYPSNFVFGPTQKVAFPNVAFSTMTEFGQSLEKWFHRFVPIWITEYAEQTKPQDPHGVSYAQQASDARKALQLAAANPYVQMFIWFILRDSTSQTWFSGLEQASGQKKPAFSAFSVAATGIVGQAQLVRPNVRFSSSVAVPLLASHDAPGTRIGVSYSVVQGRKKVAGGEAAVALQVDQYVTFPVAFDPVRGATYLMTVTVNDIHGATEHHVVELLTSTPAVSGIRT